MPVIQTLPDLIFQAIPHFNKPDCMMAKRDGKYVNISASEIAETAEALSAALQDLGVQKGDRIGLLSETRPEWAFADLAILSAAGVTVPVYSTLPPAQIEYLIKDSGMEIIFVSGITTLQKILEIRDRVPQLRRVIVMDAPQSLPDQVVSLTQLVAQGKSVQQKNPGMVRERAALVKPDDIFTIVYTSGTTGMPKGVMLTHSNVISNIEAVLQFFQFCVDDRALSFLPLSHIFERMAGYYCLLYAGTTIAYAESVEAMPKNLQEVRPTILMSVPRVYEKFYSRIMDNVASEHGLKKKIAVWALKAAEKKTEAFLQKKPPSFFFSIRYALADAFVLSKIRNRLGGSLRLLVSGGAALPRSLAFFFHGIGLTILEGYGLTETSPVIACNRPDQFKFGTVGPAIPGVEIKIAEDGEILTRGPHVMKGYFNKPKETSEAITPDGWFRTGDIGEIDADGFLRITDRKKDLIVTSAGKNIAPQCVENVLKPSRYVSQIVIVGDKRKFPSALVVPNMDNLKKFAAANGIPETEIFTDPAVVKEVQNDFERLSRDLASFERVKKIALLEHEFTVESGELTPSLKVKRSVVEKKYKDLIDEFYSDPVLN